MSLKVLGISGSPIKDSNTDRLVKAVLEATGVESEFVKLSTITVRPCLACKKCVQWKYSNYWKRLIAANATNKPALHLRPQFSRPW